MTTENNKIIAEFMSWDSNESKTVFYEPTDEVQGIDGFTLENLPFDSWNWLMEVVEKIENLSKENETYSFSITKISVRVLYKGSRIVDLPIDNSKIEAVYSACVEFIKYYNEQTR